MMNFIDKLNSGADAFLNSWAFIISILCFIVLLTYNLVSNKDGKWWNKFIEQHFYIQCLILITYLEISRGVELFQILNSSFANVIVNLIILAFINNWAIIKILNSFKNI
jgi:hypothetical protein